jgi:DNA polymerase-3 subunit gamma/tau
MSFEMTMLRMLAFRPTSPTAAPRPQVSTQPRINAAPAPAPATPAAPTKPVADVPAPEAKQPVARAANGAPDWAAVLQSLDLRGPARQLADNCDLQSSAGGAWQLVLARDKEHLNTQQLKTRIETALQEQYGREIRISITVGAPARPTPADIRKAGENQRAREAREAIEGDPAVKAVQAAFDATLEPDSIRSTK